MGGVPFTSAYVAVLTYSALCVIVQNKLEQRTPFHMRSTAMAKCSNAVIACRLQTQTDMQIDRLTHTDKHKLTQTNSPHTKNDNGNYKGDASPYTVLSEKKLFA